MSTPEENQPVAVKWHRPGHRHHNAVHLVSRTLVSPHPGPDQIGATEWIVRWLRKGKEPEIWEGTVEDGSSPDADKDVRHGTRGVQYADTHYIQRMNARAENEIQPLPHLTDQHDF